MNYRIMHETERSLRLRLRYAPLGESEEALLRFRLQKLPSVRSVSFFRQTGGILISFSGGREEILSLLLRGEEEELRRSARCLDFLTNLLEKNARIDSFVMISSIFTFFHNLYFFYKNKKACNAELFSFRIHYFYLLLLKFYLKDHHIPLEVFLHIVIHHFQKNILLILF